MKWLAWCAAVMAALAVWLWLRRHETFGQSRLSDLHGCVDGGAGPKDQTPAGQRAGGQRCRRADRKRSGERAIAPYGKRGMCGGLAGFRT